MNQTTTQDTAELPTLPDKPRPPERCSTSIMASSIFGSVLAGALLLALAWWWSDPQIPPAAKMNITFMTLTSGAVVGLFYAIVKSVGRWIVREILIAMDVQAQSLRSQLCDFQHELADARKSAVAHRERVEEALRRRTQRSPLPPRQGRRARRGAGYAAGFVDGLMDKNHPTLTVIKGNVGTSGNGDHRPGSPRR